MSYLQINSLSKRFGTKAALANLTFSVNRGESVLLLGRNGAGKSTLLSCIAGALRADSGEIVLDGEALSPSSRVSRARQQKIGFLGHESFFYAGLTLRENFELVCGLYRDSDSFERIESFGAELRLTQFFNLRISECSQGTAKRAAIMRAMLHHPELLLLDEPLANLDPEGRQAVLELLRIHLGSGRTLIMSTNEPDFIASHVGISVILESGRAA